MTRSDAGRQRVLEVFAKPELFGPRRQQIAANIVGGNVSAAGRVIETFRSGRSPRKHHDESLALSAAHSLALDSPGSRAATLLIGSAGIRDIHKGLRICALPLAERRPSGKNMELSAGTANVSRRSGKGGAVVSAP